MAASSPSNLANLAALELKKFSKVAEESYTLPSRYFFDPAIYEREKEEIFFKHWWFAGHRSEVSQPGNYITRAIFDQSILIVRGSDNVLRAFYNVCTHRAFELVQG